MDCGLGSKSYVALMKAVSRFKTWVSKETTVIVTLTTIAALMAYFCRYEVPSHSHDSIRTSLKPWGCNRECR